jgi:hypothetical protein
MSFSARASGGRSRKNSRLGLEISTRSNGASSATISFIFVSIAARSSGVNARGKRKSYWNFSEWSRRPAS